MLSSQLIIDFDKQEPSVKTSLIDVTDKLPQRPPCRIFFKNEFEQPSGSFKLRGIGHLVSRYVKEAKRTEPGKQIHVFASSGGNAGLAAAYLARYYNVNCTVAIPRISKPEIKKKLCSYGAEIIISGESIYEADQHLKLILQSVDRDKIVPIYCHPFENPLIWEGHSTIIDEIEMQMSDIDLRKVRGIVCSVGGGGLYNGIHQGLLRSKLKLDILLIETKQAPTFHETVKAGSIVTLGNLLSVATSLACSYLSGQAFENYKDQSQIKTILESIDDLESLDACVSYYDNLKRVTEPACGASLSVVYNQPNLLQKTFENLIEDEIIIVVVCGGSCTTLEGIEEFKGLLADNIPSKL